MTVEKPSQNQLEESVAKLAAHENHQIGMSKLAEDLAQPWFTIVTKNDVIPLDVS